MESIGTPSLWIGFTCFVLVMLALDLGVFHRDSHVVKVKEALIWSGVWIALSAVFGGLVYYWFGSQRALEFAAGYVLEKSLSVDNVFVFVMLFSAFAVPAIYQHRILFWGVLGALLLRGVFIAAGAAILQRFHWVMYVFGGLLLITAFKLFRESKHEPEDPHNSAAFRFFSRIIPSTKELHGKHFLVRVNGKLLATPLLLVLLLVEVTDLIFALDSIPAIFAVTDDPFIVYTSNVFAILGLRSLYFALAGFVERFYYLKPALALILGFVAVKMLIMELYKVPIGASLLVIALLLLGAVVLSIWRDRKLARLAAQAPSDSSTKRDSTSSILNGFSN